MAGTHVPAVKSSAHHHYWAAALFACGVAAALAGYFATREPASSEVTRPVLVVLPFHGAGANSPDQTLLAEELSRDVVTQLAHVEGLRVIAPVSAARAQAEKFDLKQLTARLHVNRALEGSVRLADDRLLVELRLSALPDGRTLWAQAYTRRRDEWYELQRQIAHALAETFDLHYAATAAPAVDARHLLDYLAARRRLASGDRARGMELLHTLIAAAPDLGAAKAMLARASLADLRRDNVDESQNAEVARLVQEALTSAPDAADAQTARAVLACRAAQWAACFDAFRRAIALDPVDTDARVTYAYWLAALGYVEQGLREAETAWAADPLGYDANFARGRLLDTVGRHDEAKDFFDAATPPTAGLVYARWHNALWRGDLPAAREYAAAMPQSDGFRESYLGITEAFADPSRWAQVQPLIGTSERATGRVNVLRIMLPNPDYPVEIEGLERMLRNGWPSYYLLLWMPEYRALRADPAFAVFLARNGILDYWRANGFPPGCAARGGGVRCD